MDWSKLEAVKNQLMLRLDSDSETDISIWWIYRELVKAWKELEEKRLPRKSDYPEPFMGGREL